MKSKSPTSEYLIPGVPGAQLLSTLEEYLTIYRDDLVHIIVDETGPGRYLVAIRYRVAPPLAAPAACPGIIDADALQRQSTEVR